MIHYPLEQSEGFKRTRDWPAVLHLNPIENVDALGGKLLVETESSDKQEHRHPCTHRQWDKLPQQLLDNVMQSMVDECCITRHGGHIPK
ncbi:hypothetical protein TNCV_1818231 [Trichonephila clavipes]|nr:hypothetical protein TNCV_1818231 [Trichonephila clavipes]